LRRRVR
jgi:hypothetical protein